LWRTKYRQKYIFNVISFICNIYILKLLKLVIQNHSCLFISTVKPFSNERLNQLISNQNKEPAFKLSKSCKNLLHLKELKSIVDFTSYLTNDMKTAIETYNYKVIFIDSIVGLLDVEFIDSNNKTDLISRSSNINM